MKVYRDESVGEIGSGLGKKGEINTISLLLFRGSGRLGNKQVAKLPPLASSYSYLQQVCLSLNIQVLSAEPDRRTELRLPRLSSVSPSYVVFNVFGLLLIVLFCSVFNCISVPV